MGLENLLNCRPRERQIQSAECALEDNGDAGPPNAPEFAFARRHEVDHVLAFVFGT